MTICGDETLAALGDTKLLLATSFQHPALEPGFLVHNMENYFMTNPFYRPEIIVSS